MLTPMLLIMLMMTTLKMLKIVAYVDTNDADIVDDKYADIVDDDDSENVENCCVC